MAVDKKSQHVGNHGGAYTDESGMSRQFTYIDHDKKPTFSFINLDEEFDHKKYRENLVNTILEISASLCPEPFYHFTVRGEDMRLITWNDNMLRDNGLTTDKLRDLSVLLENRVELLDKGIHS